MHAHLKHNEGGWSKVLRQELKHDQKTECIIGSVHDKKNKKFKLLGDILKYDLYYSLAYSLKWKFFRLETCIQVQGTLCLIVIK